MVVLAGLVTTGSPARATGATGIDRVTVARNINSVTMTRSCTREEKKMIDDIVTQLRNECQCSDDCRAVGDPCIAMRAADEIERLRAGFQLMAKAYAADLGMDRHGWDADKMCEEFLRKAVRGE